MQRGKFLAVLVLVAFVAFVVPHPASGIKVEAAKPNQAINVGCVFATGGLGDKSFNDMAKAGLDKAIADGLMNSWTTGSDFSEPDEISEYDQMLEDYATGDYDLIVSIGFDQATAVNTTALAHPNQPIVLIDMFLIQENVRSVLFKASEGSFLVGAMASLMTETNKVGFVGGMDISRQDISRQALEDIIIEQLQHYSKTGERLYSSKDINRVVGHRRPRAYIISYIQDLFHTSSQGAKIIYEMAFGRMSISYHSLRRACERGDLELLTTPTEWFILVQNIEFVNRDAFLFPKQVSGKRALQYLYVLVKCKNDHIGAKTVSDVLHGTKPFTCKSCERYDHFKKVGLARGFMLVSSREEFDEAIGKALEVGEKTEMAVLEWRHLVDGCNHQFDYSFYNMREAGSCPECRLYGRASSSGYFMVNPRFDLKKLPDDLRAFVLQEKANEGKLPFDIPTDLTSISVFPKFMIQKQLGAAFTVDYVEKFVKRANIKVTLTSKVDVGELSKKYGSISNFPKIGRAHV